MWRRFKIKFLSYLWRRHGEFMLVDLPYKERMLLLVLKKLPRAQTTRRSSSLPRLTLPTAGRTLQAGRSRKAPPALAHKARSHN